MRPKIALVVTPFSDENLRLASQIGVNDIVYYDMATMPDTVEELQKLKDRVQACGMKLSVIEGGPPMEKIKRGEEGRDEEIEHFIKCIRAMAEVGIHTMCYNFMPPEITVARTSYSVSISGGAMSSEFKIDNWNDNAFYPPGSQKQATSRGNLWENAGYFLSRVVPVAEECKVHLALHPDDPPLPELRGVPRIIHSIEDLVRYTNLVPSEYNGATFCQGTISEMGVNLHDAARKLGDKVKFVHFRDVVGKVPNFVEVFQDQGQTDMLGMLRTWKDLGFSGPIRPDHVPLLEGEAGHELGSKGDGYVVNGRASGYTMLGRLYAVGYMQGLFEAVWGRNPRYAPTL